jgi:hypothetical protein
MIDSEMLDRAKKAADKRCRLPQQTPITAAALAAVLTLPGLVLFDGLVRNIGFTAATLIAVVVVAGLAYLDCNQKWGIHNRAFREALAQLQEDRSAEG